MNRVGQGAAAILPIGIAVATCMLLFALAGYDIISVILGVTEGALTGFGSFQQTLRWAMPLLLIALGFLFCLRAGEFNIGGQGQMMMGGLGSVAVALLFPGPVWIAMPTALLAGMLCGLIWSGFAGFLKVRYHADEVIVTLMLNFIAVLLVSWVTTGPLKDPAVRGETASTPKIDSALRLGGSDGISPTLLILVGLAILAAWVIAERSRMGVQLRYVGKAPQAARWQGMAVRRLKFQAYLLAGTFAGLAGAFEVLGPNGRLVTGATPTIGFTAIVVTIVGLSRVPGIVIAAIFFGGLQAAILFLPIVSDLPSSGIKILEGMIALFVTAEFLRHWRQR
ncbi:MAG: ABC transporter permease [Rhodobacter sp.]|nr:ABC transporter permease [Rhodobacter sp.]MCY4169035.1 ABC transporter permease [Rhodobacter sp.]MCY4240305.1 ABC transporter permease [Rhodobacter sp.]